MNYKPEGTYSCTPLIHVLRAKTDIKFILENITMLLKYGAKPKLVDSDGRDVFMWAAILNLGEAISCIIAKVQPQSMINLAG